MIRAVFIDIRFNHRGDRNKIGSDRHVAFGHLEAVVVDLCLAAVFIGIVKCRTHVSIVGCDFELYTIAGFCRCLIGSDGAVSCVRDRNVKDDLLRLRRRVFLSEEGAAGGGGAVFTVFLIGNGSL